MCQDLVLAQKCASGFQIDECGEGACKVCGGPQASANGNHDNPGSSNHPGTVTLNAQWKIKYLPILT